MFHDWGEFYLLAGSAAAVLIGLIFVVVTLMQDKPRSQMMYGSRLYMGPTVLQVSFVLVLSAAALTPGIGAQEYALVAAVLALWGLVRGVQSTLGINALKGEDQPHWTDKWFYGVIPIFPVRRTGRSRLGLLARGGVGGARDCRGHHRHPAARHPE